MIEHVAYFYQPILTAVNQINMEMNLSLEKMRERCGFQLYADATGSSGGIHSRHNLIGFNYTTWGAFTGLEYATPWGGIGVLVDYEAIRERPFHELERLNFEYVHGSLYGAFFPTEALSFNAIIGGGTAQRSTSISIFDAYLGAEYAINPCIAPLTWTPLFALQYIHLGFNRRDIESFRTLLGLKASYTFCIEGIFFTPEINWVWEREFLHRRQFVPFEIKGPHKSVYLTGADLVINFCNGLNVNLSYEYEGCRSFFNHSYYAGALVAF